MKILSSYKLLLAFSSALFSVAAIQAATSSIKLKIARSTYSDETIIRFISGATIDFDSNYDAWKLFSFSASVPNIYSKTPNADELSINSIPELSSSITKELFLKIGTAATYTISVADLSGFAADVSITLKDLVTGQLYNLRTVGSFTKSLPVLTTSSAARFSILFSFPVSSQVTNATCSSCLNGSVVLTKAGESNWQYSLVDSLGNTAAAGTASSSSQTINSLAPRSYTATITNTYSVSETILLAVKTSPPILLPVVLLQFDASVEKESVKLTWSTASESNSDYFIIERSTDGFNFSVVGKNKAAGNSSNPINYEMKDMDPIEGNSFYRLTQEDLNGALWHSELKSVDFSKAQVSVFPNPTSDYCIVTLLNSVNVETHISIMDMLGKECMAKSITPSSDLESISFSLDDSFASGTYSVVVFNKNSSVKKNIVVK